MASEVGENRFPLANVAHLGAGGGGFACMQRSSHLVSDNLVA